MVLNWLLIACPVLTKYPLKYQSRGTGQLAAVGKAGRFQKSGHRKMVPSKRPVSSFEENAKALGFEAQTWRVPASSGGPSGLTQRKLGRIGVVGASIIAWYTFATSGPVFDEKKIWKGSSRVFVELEEFA